MEMPPILLLELLARVVLAAVLGGLVGLERERVVRPAGLRTHMLVCVGSALVMAVSTALAANGNTAVDITRIGAQVVSGIGFLGAGTIIKEGATVKGLTTAASLWAISCVGIAAGSGFYVLSTATTLALLAILHLMHRSEAKIKYGNLSFVLEAEPDLFDTGSFTQYLEGRHYQIVELRLADHSPCGKMQVQVEVRFPKDEMRGTSRRDVFQSALQGYPAIRNVFDA